MRIDYGKLRHLLVVNRRSAEGAARLNGNFDLLRGIIGTETADARIQPSFPLKRLIKRENFLSLLHCFGLLSIREVVHGVPRLAIPNQTVKRLMYGYLREAYEDAGAFDVNLYEFEQRMNRMANAGEWRPVFEFLAEAIAAQTGIRDYIAGEKVLQGFLAAYLSVTDYFVFRSEAELGKGHADISLEPLLARFPHLERGYLVELKYLRRERSGRREPHRRGLRRSECAASALPGGRTPLAPVPGGALHGPGPRVPRLGDGVLRCGSAGVTACPGGGRVRGPRLPVPGLDRIGKPMRSKTKGGAGPRFRRPWRRNLGALAERPPLPYRGGHAGRH